MKLPKEIKIGPVTYKILRVPADHPELENQTNNARIDPNDGIIYVRKHGRSGQVKVWLLHELIHGCHFHVGKYDDVARTDEEWIDATTPTLLQIIIDNPKLIEFLQSVPPKKNAQAKVHVGKDVREPAPGLIQKDRLEAEHLEP